MRSVAQIYRCYKKFCVQTEVMGASFHNIGQIIALADCDLLIISPELLAQLQGSDASLSCRLDARSAAQADIQPVSFNGNSFRYVLNEDAICRDVPA